MTVQELFEHYGTAQAAADKLGYTARAIRQWRDKGRIPPKAQRLIQAQTRGKLRA